MSKWARCKHMESLRASYSARHTNHVLEPIYCDAIACVLCFSIPIVSANKWFVCIKRFFEKFMKPRVLSIILSLINMLVAGAITVAFAFTSQGVLNLKSNQQKNDVVFNWGIAS